MIKQVRYCILKRKTYILKQYRLSVIEGCWELMSPTKCKFGNLYDSQLLTCDEVRKVSTDFNWHFVQLDFLVIR
ncbi:hypothetical protein I3760_01G104700 [Carya illinoinensis]|nr:hypothetical protein I3760_01G104700 [Carya illinoinensis]